MANRFFDIAGSRENSPEEDPERHYKSKFLLAHFENVNKLETNLQRLPSEEEFFFLQTNNSFNAFTFIPFICKYVTVRRLFASTYSISRKVIEALMELQRTGLVEEITLLISDSMIKRNPMTIDVLLGIAATNGNLKVLFGWNHSKVCLLESPSSSPEGGESQYFVIEGSGNWADNAQMEQYTFANCRGLYDFRMDLFAPEKARQVAAGGYLKTVNN
jgi:hypothetical protein